MSTWRRWIALGLSAAAIAVLAAVLATASGGSRARPTRAARRRTAGAARATPPAGAVVLNIGGGPSGRAIPAGFLGLSFEYPAVEAYTGTDPAAVDPVLVQLIRNLTPGQAPVLRIGGESTDTTWWPVAGMARPAGVNYTLTPGFVAVLHALAATLGARLILGINLEADSAVVARAEARALVAGVGRSRVEGLELGNEPELYPVFTWDGSGRKGRAPGYNFADYNRDVTRVGAGLTFAPQAGPDIGAVNWYPYLRQFLASHPRVVVATLHRYPLQLCYVSPREPNYPTIPHLLSSYSSRRLANSVVAAVAVAHARGIPLRIDEMNTISCGRDDAVSRSFASALWALDALFEMASVGVDGVNFHSYPGATYEPFSFSRKGGVWRAAVEPEYYGLEMFARAAPPGSHLANVSEADAGQVKAWATRAADGTVRVLAINDGSGARTVAVRLATPHGAGTLERLEGHGLSSRSGVTLGGQSFGPETTTGLLAGRQRTDTVAPSGRLYTFKAPGASADLLTIPPAG